MNITIVGCGNIGTQFAVHCAEKQHNVTMFGSKPGQICKNLDIVDETGSVRHRGTIAAATDDAQTAFSQADIIFVTMPAYCMKTVAEQIFPYIHADTMIGLIPGTGGGECAFRHHIRKGAVVFGMQRVPGVARLEEYGKRVCVTGYREKLHICALPKKYTEQCCHIMEELFDIKCEALPNYLNLTLTPSNPILHTTRLRVLFCDYVEGMVYDRVPLFYEEWNNESSELLLKCDEEVQNICRDLPEFDLSGVTSLKVHYESKNMEELTKKITGIKGFKGLKSPVIEKNGAYVPDFHSRYFTADFPYGLSIIRQIADFAGTKTPNIIETMQWYDKVKEEDREFRYEDFGINSREDFIMFYTCSE